MTDTAVETASAAAAPTSIPHWIAGRRQEGSNRTAPVFNPALGTAVSEVALASADEVGEAIATAKAAFPAWRDLSIAKRQAIMFRFRELIVSRKDDLARIITREHGKVHADALGEIARAHRGRRARDRVPAADQGRVLRERVDRRRRLLAAPAARRRRHHQPVQLPGDGAAVVRADRARLRQLRRAQAEREGPVGVGVDRRALPGGGPARRRAHRRARRQGGRRHAAHASGRRGRLVRRLHAHRAVRLRDRRRSTASACRRSAARRTTCSCCPTPTSTSPRMQPSTRASARPASAAWRSRWSSRSTRSPTSSRRRSPRRWAASAPGDGTRDNDMGPLITGAHRDKVAGYIQTAADDGATLLVDGRDPEVDGDPNGFWIKPTLIDKVPTDSAAYTRGDLRTRAVDRARRLLRGGPRAHQREPVRQRHGDLHERRRRGAPLPERGAGGHGRHQRADPGARRLPLVRRLEAVDLRDRARRTASTRTTSTPARRSSRAAGSTRATAASTSASPPTDRPSRRRQWSLDPPMRDERPLATLSQGRRIARMSEVPSSPVAGFTSSSTWRASTTMPSRSATRRDATFSSSRCAITRCAPISHARSRAAPAASVAMPRPCARRDHPAELRLPAAQARDAHHEVADEHRRRARCRAAPRRRRAGTPAHHPRSRPSSSASVWSAV